VRWLATSTWHLTLLFLGWVAVSRVPELVALVDATAADAEAFETAVAGGGGRARDADGVAWLRVAGGAGRVIDLAERLAIACSPAISLGFEPRRTPSAHLTVARRTDRALVDDLRGETRGRLRAAWTADRLALMRSHLGPSGAAYETVHEATLYAASPAGREPAADEEGRTPWR
jgi:2'-5' RNA ligase